ncbi:MAG: hypothetical protein GWO41_04695 [candidate division Zixibacteria bacterium]|nr:hypothetical protein [candidate division Zixibacteria bacterium]NIR67831.1 hypothetical protein [candidate division Zixibacteria bacterium]NIS49056.1 hypothetical protein [candidate division Zixibacteria bacterium]NIT52050.1 hypothetical protein [candidate division Zixibacteria bacterium]NIU17142.1 hypothetical protein [candidate division Zixibacteria bacterium]
MNIFDFTNLRLKPVLLTHSAVFGLFHFASVFQSNPKLIQSTEPTAFTCEVKTKPVFIHQNILNIERGRCLFFEQLRHAMQYIFSALVQHEVEGKDTCRGKINPDFALSSPSSITDRHKGILHPGELENNIVNTNVKAQGKTLYEC